MDLVAERVRTLDPTYRAPAEWRGAPGEADGVGSILVTYKDTIDVAGATTRAGSHSGYRSYPRHSATIAEALGRRRFAYIGKAATTEFSLSTAIPCLNPTFPEFSPGGSSTGCAVAVAAGLCDISVATDAAGSSRWPAVNCGVVGLMLGPLPRFAAGVVPVSPRLDRFGLMARTVDDLEYVWTREDLGALFGSAPRRHADPLGYRLGVVTNFEDTACHPDVRSAFDRLTTALKDRGFVADRHALPGWDFRARARSLLIREAYDVLERLRRRVDLEYEASTRNALLLGRDVDDRAYETLKAEQTAVAARVGVELQQAAADLLILPLDPHLPRLRRTAPPATSVPTARGQDPGYAIVANAAGLPALALPIARAATGAPIGLQILAAPGGEADLLQVGAVIERVARFREGGSL